MITSQPWLLTREVGSTEYEGAGGVGYASDALDHDGLEGSNAKDALFRGDNHISWIEGSLKLSF